MPATRIRHKLRAWLIFAVLFGTWPVAAQDGEVMVQTYCAACHSLALVYSQTGNNRFWRNTIDLMREKHNLGPIPAEREAAIITFLAKRAAPQQLMRRLPLEPPFLPDVLPDAQGT